MLDDHGVNKEEDHSIGGYQVMVQVALCLLDQTHNASEYGAQYHHEDGDVEHYYDPFEVRQELLFLFVF